MKQPNFTELKAMYVAANELMAKLGMDGMIDTDDPLVDNLMNSMHDIDSGDYLQGEILDSRFEVIYLNEKIGRQNEVDENQPNLFKEDK